MGCILVLDLFILGLSLFALVSVRRFSVFRKYLVRILFALNCVSLIDVLILDFGGLCQLLLFSALEVCSV